MLTIEGLVNGKDVLFSEMKLGVQYLGELPIAQENELVMISRSRMEGKHDIVTIHMLEEEEGKLHLKQPSEFECSVIMAKVGNSLLELSNDWKGQASDEEYGQAMDMIHKMDSRPVADIPLILVTLFEEVLMGEISEKDKNNAYWVK